MRGSVDGRAQSTSPQEKLELLDGIQRRVLWLAVSMIHHANKVRTARDDVKVGGHQASSASMVSIMTALYFEHLGAHDRVSVKPHASPVLHAINYLLGRLDEHYLTELRALRDRTRARWVSDHLCWTGVAGKNTHDLLPLPYTEENLRHVAARVRAVQDVLGAPLAVENPSSYVEHAGASMREWEFLARLAEEADCAILLDVNNVFVSAHNHGFAPATYLAAMPYDRVVQFHVAGHTDHGTHIIDSHIGPVPDAVWKLLGQAHAQSGGASVLMEWDAEIPDFETTHAEALRAKEYIRMPSPVPS